MRLEDSESTLSLLDLLELVDRTLAEDDEVPQFADRELA
jgi:hypothetical protein